MTPTKQYLNDFVVKNGRPRPKDLPVCHTCSAFDFFKILDQQTLITSYCEDFSQNLLYFFYGKPSYRYNETGKNFKLDAYLPVCIVLKPNSIRPTRLAPFDTGAWSLYHRLMHSRMLKDEFFLRDIDSVKCLVDVFFSDNKGYCRGLVNKDLSISFSNFHASSYRDLISNKTEPFDQRCKTVEFQYDNNVELKKEDVELLVLPDRWLDDISSREQVEKLLSRDTPIATYRVNDLGSGDYYGVINDHVYQHLLTKGYLS